MKKGKWKVRRVDEENCCTCITLWYKDCI
jgi:hypothetical protein